MWYISWFVQKQPPEVFCKKGNLKKFANFTGKQLCWDLFSVKLQTFSPATKLKKTPAQVFSYNIFEIFKNIYKNIYERLLRFVSLENTIANSSGKFGLYKT